MLVKLMEAVISGNVYTDRHERTVLGRPDIETRELTLNAEYVVTTRPYFHDGKEYTKIETSTQGEIIVVGSKRDIDAKLDTVLKEGRQLLKG